MREAAALRRARLVLSIGLSALGAVIVIPSCAAWMAHDSPGRPAATRPAADAGPRRGAKHQAAAPRPAARRSPCVPNSADAELAVALARVLRGHPGRLAVGVIDERTGAMATYHGSWTFNTASIVKADILAVLLIQHQQIGASLSSAERQLAIVMIEDSDNNAATALWDAVGGGPGLEAGNAVLGLRHTWPSLTGAWGLTTVTVTDQLRLLTDLTSARSPLDTANRAYELSLMRHVEAGQGWGVTSAADPGSSPAVKNGWLPVSSGWVINSIGVVTHADHQLLIAVLSTGAPTENDGSSQVQAAAKAAAAIAGALHNSRFC